MTFEAELSDTAKLVNNHLDRLLGRTEPQGNDRLLEAMCYATLGGGKRIRPFLVLQSCKLFGGEAHAALDVAGAVEMIHCYSLVHDDLPAMDDDELRRGRATCHKAYDEATAILAGDALQALAFEVLASSQAIGDPAIRMDLVRDLAIAVGRDGMVGGQMRDLLAETGRDQDLSCVARTQAMKTGALIGFCLMAGARVARAAQQDRERVSRFGDALGLAFQISDDLLDAEGDVETVGKATGKDAAAGKATFLALLGADGARKKLAELRAAGEAALEPYGDRAAALVAAMHFVIARQR